MGIEIQGKKVGDVGFGIMGFTAFYGDPTPPEQAIPVMKAALEAGCNYWNAGEFYGKPEYNSMTLLRQYFEKYPEDVDKVIVCFKGCIAVDPATKTFRPDGSRDYVRKSADNILSQLGGHGRINQLEPARKDAKTEIEVTVNALDELVKEGKIGGVALSEVSADSIRRAAKITKIQGVEVEVSLFSTEIFTNGVAEACAELDIPIIAYSPLHRGMFTRSFKTFDDIPKDDFRKTLPRWQPGNFEINMKIVDKVEEMARARGCTSGQIAISWLTTLGARPGMPKILPIPGTTKLERVKENATVFQLTDQEMATLDDLLKQFPTVGNRYNAHGMEMLGESA